MPTVQGIKAGMAVKAPVAKTAKAVKNVVAKSTAKVAEGNKGAQALADQNKVLLTYKKPTVKVIELENPKSLRAASGAGEGGWTGGRRSAFEDVETTPTKSIWE